MSKVLNFNAADFNAAKTNPSKFFERPNDVCNTHALTRSQKIEILRQWETDARLMSVAEEENMQDGESNRLQEVVKALIALGDEKHVHPDETSAAPAKLGGSS